jgi:hypothetical protein
VGVHNDLSGLNVGDYQHLTSAEKSAALSKASLSDITFANLIGVYTDNASLVSGFATKQNALSGLGYVKASGGTITYDNSTFLTSVTGIVAANTPGGGEITGTYASPTLSNAAVTGQLLLGFNPNAATGVLSNADSIFSAIEKLNANVKDVVATSGTINEITFSLPGGVFDFTAGPFTSGAVPLSGTFLDQSQNYFFAGPSGGGTGQPTFRAIVPGDFPVSGATAGTYGSASSIPVIQVDTYGRVTTIANVTAASGGQVNTITYSVPAGVFTQSVTGTSAVSITLGLSTQTATHVWAGPVSGAAAGPQFRALQSTDIPNIDVSQVNGLFEFFDFYLPNSLANSAMFIGNGSDAAVNATVTGDLALLYVDNAPTNEAEFTIQPGVVSYAKIQDVSAQKLLGRYALAAGPAQEITFDPLAFTLNSSTGVLGLVTPNPSVLTAKGDLLTATGPTTQVRLGIGANATLFMADSAVVTGNKWVAMSGDATIATSGAITIGAAAVTLAKMANLAANSFIGNNTGSAATPIALTVTQATAMLNQFTTSAKGLVPAASGGLDATYFLNATGAWSVPAGGGGSGTVTSVSVVSANGFAGTVATPTVAAAITLSTTITGLLKGNGTAISAATAGTDYVSPGAITATSGAGAGLTMSTSRLLGRYTASTGSIEEISVGSGLNLSVGGVLTAPSTMVYPGAGIANSTGSAWDTSYGVSGANSVVLRDSSQNISVNNVNAGTTTTATSGQTILLTTASSFVQVATGTTSNIFFNLPNATTLPVGATFQFNNNTTSGSVSIRNYTIGTTIYTLPAGGAVQVILTSNSTTDGVWDAFVYIPKNVTWGTSTLTATGTDVIFKSLTSGVTGTTAGTLVLRNTVGSATQTIRGTDPTTSIIYDLPTTAPTAGYVLSASAPSGGVSTLSWIAGGGSGTVGSGTVGQVAYYTASTTVGSTTVAGVDGTKILSQVVTGGVGATPAWTAVTGSGSVVLATSPTLVTPVLGTPASGNFSTGTFTWPTFNQNTTGSAASLTTARTILTDLASTTAGSFDGTTNINIGVTGVLPIAQGGTAVNTVPANGQLLIGNGTGYTVAALTAGAGITITNGAGTITLGSSAASPTLNNIVASTGSSSINNVLSTIQWNWNSNTTTGAFVLNSTNITAGALLAVTHSNSAFTAATGIVSFTSAAVTTGTILSVAHSVSSLSGNVASFTSSTISTGNILNLAITGTTASTADNLVITNSSTANTAGRGIDVSITGATVSGNTFGAFISNTKTGATSTNTALSLTTSGATTNYGGQINVSGAATTNYGLLISSSGGTTNYAIDVTAGIVRLAASTASLPHMIFSPGAAALTATTNGMLSYATVSSNSTFYLYKDSAVTTILTKDRNPEFVTGAQGVVVADASGNFTKSADLTALGIFAAYNTTTLPNTTTTATTMVSGSLVGSKTLPANFFALGKTIVFKASGFITLDNSRTFTFRTSLGATLNIDVVLEHSGTITSGYWDYTCSVTCKAISGTNSTYIYAAQVVCVHNNTTGANVIFGAAADSGTIAVNTGATIAVDILGNFDGTTAGDTFTAYQATSQYLN